MAHIDLDPNLPGMRQLISFSPETAGPIGKLANLMLRTNIGLTMAERELIATYVSHLNDCFYCEHSHGAIATCYLGGDSSTVDQLIRDYHKAPISEKLKALLSIAASVQKGGKNVNEEQIKNAKESGATDREIHDTVLIAALFCLFNRYVDGLATNTPSDLSTYPLRAKQIVEQGYGDHIVNNPQPA